MLAAIGEQAIAVVQALQEHEERAARVRHDVREVRIALEDPGVDEARRRHRRVEDEADAQRQLELLLLQIGWEHRMLEHRQLELVDLRPHRLEARIVHMHAGDVRADHHAMQSELADDAVNFL